MNATNPSPLRDIYFAPVGGTGGIADPVQFYRALHIPVAVIADLDLILEAPRIRRVLEKLTDKSSAERLHAACAEIAGGIGELTPAIPESEALAKLRELGTANLSWANKDDEGLVKELRSLMTVVDRKKRLKRGGLGALDGLPDLKGKLESFIKDCAGIGLFLVPVGELEYWSPTLMDGTSLKDNKAEWANEFAKRVHEHPEQATDIVEFLHGVERFHSAEVERLSRDVRP